MGKLISIMFVMVVAWMPGDYPLKNGKPTSRGIQKYVEEKSDSLVMEFQNFVRDTLFNVWIYSGDPEECSSSDITDPVEMGWFFPHEIYISTAERYEAYELNDLSPVQRKRLCESNKFVKAVIIHELTHEYVNQIGVEMQSVHHIHVDKSYQCGIWIVKSHTTFGSSFIEEGICEYLTGKMGELIPPKKVEIPATVEELLDRNREYRVKYKYAAAFLKTFLDTTGLKKGIQILIYNPPPTYEEILQSERFFERLELPENPEAVQVVPAPL